MPVNLKLGALADVAPDKYGLPPALMPNLNVCVTVEPATNPPVPLQLKLKTVSILIRVELTVGSTNTMSPVPNSMLRVFELDELNIPVVNVNPFKANVPDVKLVVAVVAVDNAPANVVVPV